MRLDVMNQIGSALNRLVSGSAETSAPGGTGNLRGATVQMAATAQQPAHSAGIGERLKTLLAPLAGALKDAKAWLQAKMQPAPAPQVPVSQPRIDTNRTATQIQGRIEYAALTKSGSEFRAGDGALTPEIRNAITHAFGYELMESFANSSDQVQASQSFMRDNNTISKIASNTALRSPQMDAVASSVRAIIGDTPVILSRKSLGLTAQDEGGPTQPAHPALAAGGQPVDRQAAADASVATIDRVMVELFGDPDDRASIEAALDRLPRELCDQLGTMNALIDATGARVDDALKKELKTTAGRDIFALRAINPALLARPGIATNDSRALSSSVMSVAKAVQNLVNGHGIALDGKEAAPEVSAAGAKANMQARWADGFEKFLAAASARADQEHLAQAAADAPQLLATRDRLVAELDRLRS